MSNNQIESNESIFNTTLDLIVNGVFGGADNYRIFEAVNYSTISKLETEPYKALEESLETKYFNFGSLVDCLITTPELVDNKFIKAKDFKLPTGQMENFCRYLILNLESGDNINHFLDKAYEYTKSCNGGNLKASFETFVTNFEPYRDFVLFNLINKDKKIVTAEEYNLAIKFSENIKYSGFITNLKVEGYKFFYQVPLCTDFNGIKIKCLVDILAVNFNTYKIVPIDIKTTSKKLVDFKKAVIDYKYYLQAGLYCYIIGKCFPSFLVDNFKFIVCSKIEQNHVKVFELSYDTMYKARYGFLNFNGNKVKGFEELILDYIWHKENYFWDLPRDIAQKDIVPITIYDKEWI